MGKLRRGILGRGGDGEMGMEARTASAVLNMTNSPFVLSATRSTCTIKSCISLCQKVVGVGNSFFFFLLFQKGAFALTHQAKHFFFFSPSPFLENENQGYFWLSHSALFLILPFQGEKKE